MGNKSCATCKHAYWEEDWSVGITGGWVCDNPEVPEELFEELPSGLTEEEWDTLAAEQCLKYDPHVCDKCAWCKKDMSDILLKDVCYWGHGWESEPVCSEECKMQYERAFEGDMNWMREEE